MSLPDGRSETGAQSTYHRSPSASLSDSVCPDTRPSTVGVSAVRSRRTVVMGIRFLPRPWVQKDVAPSLNSWGEVTGSVVDHSTPIRGCTPFTPCFGVPGSVGRQLDQNRGHRREVRGMGRAEQGERQPAGAGTGEDAGES